jgi:glycosyltransferase involved in cell wall biosynthesis
VKQFLLDIPFEQQVLFAVFLFATIIQSIYYYFVFLRPARWKRKDENKNHEPLSVIICAKNEHENLKINLPKILSQKYEKFEVIVVNDCSEDDTEMLLGELEQKHRNLRHTTIEPDNKFFHGKKLAVTIGIKSAKYNQLVFTDADCYPVSENWLNEISKSYLDNKQIVLAYGGYEKGKGLLNKIIRFDTLFIGMQYLGFALCGRPYMGIGRNLSYLKQIFFSGTGFSKHYKLLSGDDDLFINENAYKDNTAIVLSKESFTKSKPQIKYRQWAKQKKRHLTTGKYYKFEDKFFIGLEQSSRLLFYITFAALLILKADIVLTFSIFGFRFITQLLIIKLNMNKMGEKGFWLLTPLFDILLPIIHFNFIISNKLNTRNNKWK